MKITVIDYGSGNVQSVVNALNTISSDQIIVSNQINDIKQADKLILPGVGSFQDCMLGLASQKGLIDEIKEQVLIKEKPFLGICVGMQVLAKIGHENGEFEGLNLISGQVKQIPHNLGLKVPHMGWNNIKINNLDHKIVKNIKNDEHFYFANSFYFEADDKNNVIATTQYGVNLDVIIAKNNILGIQFHPEKSASAGLELLKNFL